jgi:hypothetical protein
MILIGIIVSVDEKRLYDAGVVEMEQRNQKTTGDKKNPAKDSDDKLKTTINVSPDMIALLQTGKIVKGRGFISVGLHHHSSNNATAQS